VLLGFSLWNDFPLMMRLVPSALALSKKQNSNDVIMMPRMRDISGRWFGMLSLSLIKPVNTISVKSGIILASTLPTRAV